MGNGPKGGTPWSFAPPSAEPSSNEWTANKPIKSASTLEEYQKKYGEYGGLAQLYEDEGEEAFKKKVMFGAGYLETLKPMIEQQREKERLEKEALERPEKEAAALAMVDTRNAHLKTQNELRAKSGGRRSTILTSPLAISSSQSYSAKPRTVLGS